MQPDYTRKWVEQSIGLRGHLLLGNTRGNYLSILFIMPYVLISYLHRSSRVIYTLGSHYTTE